MLGYPAGVYFEKGNFKKDKKQLSNLSIKSTDIIQKRIKHKIHQKRLFRY